MYKEGDVMRTKMSNVKVDENFYDVMFFYSHFWFTKDSGEIVLVR